MRKFTLRWLLSLLVITSFALNSSAQYFTEDFEGGTIPAGWTLTNGSDDWAIDSGDDYGPGSAHGGTYCIFFNDYDYSAGVEAEIITPNIDLSGATAPELKFWYYDGGGSDDVEVLASIDGTTYNNIYTTATTVTPWTEIVVDLSAYAGEATVTISFKGVSVYGTTNPHIDDIIVEEAPTCPAPADLAVSNLAATTASLIWNAGGSETDWEVEYGAAGFAQGSGTTVTVTDTFANVTALTADTDYEFYVKAVCGAGDESTWAGAFAFHTTVSCPEPADLEVSNITTTGATLSWNAGATETDWEVEYGDAGFAQGAGTTVAATDTFVTVSSLTATTAYEFYVRAVCGAGDESIWVGPFAFATSCDVMTTPFTETFNSSSPSKQCWTVLNENGDSDEWNLSYGTNPFEGDQVAMMYTDYNSGSNDDYLVSPAITLTGNERLIYQYRVHSAAEPNNFEVLLSTTGSDAASFTNVILADADYSNTSYEEQIIDLSAYSGDVYIAFHVPAGGLDGWRLYIDQVVVEEIPACLAPSGLTVSNVTETEATLSWIAGDSETAWNVEYGTAGFAQGSGTTVTPNDTFTVVSSLTASTAYEFYVQADCGGDQSVWVGPYAFSTACGTLAPITSLPWTADFDSNIECDFTIVDSLGGVTQWMIADIANIPSGDFNNNSNSSTSCLLANGAAANGANTIMISPDIDLTGTGLISLELTFESQFQDYAGNGDAYVLVSDDAMSTWTTLFSETNDENSSGELHTLDLSAYIGSTINIAWHYTANASDAWQWAIDNISLININCPDPSALGIQNLTDQSVELMWTENGAATTWDIEWDVQGFTPTGTPTINDTPDNPYALSSLTAETAYDFYVRADCAGDDTDVSAWVGPFTFTTTAACAAPTDLAATTTTTTAELSWNGYTATNWDIEWDVEGFTPTGTPTINDTPDNPYTLGSLSPSTTYDFYVRADCASDDTDVSAWAGPFTFSTACDVVNAYPYFEGFEGAEMPLCWTVHNLDGDAKEFVINTSIAYEGSQSTTVGWNGTGNNDWLISPQFEITQGDLVIDFAARSNSDTYNEDYNVLISTTGNDPADFTIVVDNVLQAPNAWERKVYSLADHGINVNDQIYVAIQCVSVDELTLAIDAFSIHEPYSDQAEITAYTLPTQESAFISAANDSIMVTMPVGTTYPIAAIAEFTLSADAMANVGGTAQETMVTENTWNDNVNPVVYQVVAQDGITIRNWSVYVDVLVGVNDVVKSDNVNIYPNPSNGQFNLTLTAAFENATIEVVNAQGQTVATFENTDKTMVMDLSDKAEGLYFVRISTENNTTTKKVNIVR